MLVDLRASVDGALGLGSASGSDAKVAEPASPKAAPRAAAAAAGAGSSTTSKAADVDQANALPQPKFAVADAETTEFEISSAPQEWNPDADSQPGKKK
jgi:hypothetical protein